ncbi:MAG: phenylacetate--CoA ligase family protein, partial [Planctomycetes bacterium]|nr:phenylacetate--CoA ligase family protein [Planctomycetota bacterium]
MSNPKPGAPSLLARAGLAVARGLVGRRFTRGLAEFRSTLAMSADELRARQQARTRAIVAHAITRVPFWREAARGLGMCAGDVRGVDDLVRLPVVDKPVFRSRPIEHFLAEGIDEHRRIPYRTSGSTGDPFTFVLDRQAMPVVFASHLFFDSIYGLDPFDRSVRLQGPFAADPPLPVGERTTLRRMVTLEATPERLRSLIDDFAPVYLLGYTSTLAVLAEQLLADGWRPRRPLRAVITIAETLTPERRRVLEECFAAPIANRYGQREFKFWCAQSPPGDPTSFVVHTDLVVFETLRADGSPCAEDECGRVVLTNLHNEVMPFLRYDCGDLATRREPHARCPFPVMGRLEGRTQEVIRLASGK